jgi:(1->4)-alpha-D-glucan 1-alpha-D-glucosylmutase
LERVPVKPLSTYRLQLHAGFGFDAASEVIHYLRDLGISHVYCSPYLQAAPGSTHGYDVVDYGRVNSELGGEAALARFSRKLKESGLGQVLDIVPNHMAITGHYNAWWWDVLENGAASRYAPYFDIEWNAPEERLRNKILLPVLGDHYGRVLAARELRLERQQGAFVLNYHEHTFPIAPRSTAGFCREAADRSGCNQLGFLADALDRLPERTEADWPGRIAHHRDKEAIRRLLTRLFEESREAADEIDRLVEEMNADIDRLDILLSEQHYRLSFWRTAEHELVYRRFFDINSLVGVRTEDERAFADIHALVLKWLQCGRLDGVRVDHPDGLRNPAQYFRRLRSAAPNAWIVAEKILAKGERVPDSWPIDGTTGYDFLNIAGGLFIDPRGEAPLNEFYREFTGEPVDFSVVAREKKSLILREILGSDINRLTALFLQICEAHREHRDYTRHEIHEVIREIVASFPVYRSYIEASQAVVSESDELYISKAVGAAKTGRTDLDERLFDFVRDVLLLRVHGEQESEFVMRFQQITAAAMAKGVEDTAFYCYLRLTALNEVGGDPGRFGVPVDDFHKWCEETQTRQPFTLLATSTHDTKRSEDVRARIGVLSEIPERWADAVRRWAAMNARHRAGEYPDRKTEYLLYQTLAGTWPISKDRLVLYCRKAAREAKERTSWITPNVPFEEALEKFIEGSLADDEFKANLEDFLSLVTKPARVASLSQTLLKLTAPGIPDTYQGTELWDLSLVDPDNRRPVDYAARRNLLAELDHLTPEQILERSEEGLPKLWIIRQTLRLRRARPECFGADGIYKALWPSGPKAAHVIALQRGHGVIAVAPRLLANLDSCNRDSWDGTSIELPEGVWSNQLTGEDVGGGKAEIGGLLARFPVALLALEA